jgi:hypothetical protein
MGLLTAIALAESELPLENKLEWHLMGNFHPPISVGFVPLAVAACRHAANGLWDDLLVYPDGQIHSVQKTVEELYLEPFVGTIVPEEAEHEEEY